MAMHLLQSLFDLLVDHVQVIIVREVATSGFNNDQPMHYFVFFISQVLHACV